MEDPQKMTTFIHTTNRTDHLHPYHRPDWPPSSIPLTAFIHTTNRTDHLYPYHWPDWPPSSIPLTWLTTFIHTADLSDHLHPYHWPDWPPSSIPLTVLTAFIHTTDWTDHLRQSHGWTQEKKAAEKCISLCWTTNSAGRETNCDDGGGRWQSQRVKLFQATKSSNNNKSHQIINIIPFVLSLLYNLPATTFIHTTDLSDHLRC